MNLSFLSDTLNFDIDWLNVKSTCLAVQNYIIYSRWYYTPCRTACVISATYSNFLWILTTFIYWNFYTLVFLIWYVLGDSHSSKCSLVSLRHLFYPVKTYIAQCLTHYIELENYSWNPSVLWNQVLCSKIELRLSKLLTF